MQPYHKIPTIYKRDPATEYKTLIEGDFATPELDYLANNEWVWTEKVDGTNIRVHWDGETVTFGGKTNKANTPPFLVDKLAELFPVEKFSDFDTPMTLYGEGYGRKIQEPFGSQYIPDGVSFILFDVSINDWWLQRQDVLGIADTLGILKAPTIGFGTLFDAVDMARIGFNSIISPSGSLLRSEGIVLRPDVELKDRAGRRIICKIKTKDFQNT